MKTYPSIEHSAKAPRQPCYVFVKYDGSNLRFEWSKKRGWYKFGTRKHMIDETHPIYGEAHRLFLERYGDALPMVFKKSKEFRNVEAVTVFAEWFGKQSFAGNHVQDDPKSIVLFDVNPLKKGFLGPKRFLEEFGHLEVAELLQMRNLSDEFINSVRDGSFDCSSKYAIANEIPEGVICKGGDGHNLWMAKIKTQNYYDVLKSRCPEDWSTKWE